MIFPLPRRLLPALLLLLVSCGSCAIRPAVSPSAQGRLEAFRKALSGTFDTADQSGADPEYYHIVLHTVPIWTDSSGVFLYSEEALAATPRQPFRQRIYELEVAGAQLVRRAYLLPDPARFAGAYRQPARFAALCRADLRENAGCAVYYKQDRQGIYRGHTRKKSCPSELKGASYATSRQSVGNSFIQIWDRGFDKNDAQVWGATQGGYLFFRQ